MTCSMPDCDRPVRARGWCVRHYKRWQINGDPNITLKPKKKPSVRAAKNACDRLFSQIIRSEGRCRNCGTTDNLQCAHIIRRGYNATRTSTDNAIPLCARCHIHFTHEPDEWIMWVTDHVGRGEYARLKAKAVAGVGVKFDWFAEKERLSALHKEVFA